MQSERELDAETLANTAINAQPARSNYQALQELVRHEVNVIKRAGQATKGE